MSIWLGIDLGQARVGLALSDPQAILAHPAGNLQAYGDYFHVLEDVVDTIIEHHVSTVIVGLPLQLDGSAGASAKKAQRWVKSLHRAIEYRIEELQEDLATSDDTNEQALATLEHVTVHMRDERLTTVTAHHQMSQSGLSMRQHRAGVDQQSAVVLLQSALDEYHAHYDSEQTITPA